MLFLLLFLPIPEPTTHAYRAVIRSVYDGDTIRADVHVGLGIVLADHPCRLRRINAPELKGASRDAGIAARDYLAGILAGEVSVEVNDRRQREKYGRLLVEVWVSKNGKRINVSDAMVAAGHAVPDFLETNDPWREYRWRINPDPGLLAVEDAVATAVKGQFKCGVHAETFRVQLRYSLHNPPQPDWR